MSERLTLHTLMERDPAALGGLPLPTGDHVCDSCGPTTIGEPGIVHIGNGLPARAHLATYAQDLIRAGWPGGIHLVSLGHDTAGEHLDAQDHLYSLTMSESGGNSTTQVISSVSRTSAGVEAAIAAISSSATRLVTVAEDDCGNDGQDEVWQTNPDGSDEPDEQRRPNRAGEADGSCSIAEVLARGLGARDRHAPPPVVVSMDDVFMNGEVLRARVLDAASRLDDELEEWIEIEVEFPNSIIDRMVGDSSGIDLDRIESVLGLRDEAALVTEPYRSWVIESVEGLPPLADVGVELTRQIVSFERRRLWLFDGPRMALAHAGALLGCRTIAEAAEHPVASEFAARVSRAAVAVILMAAGGEPGDADPGTTEAYAESVLLRLANPAVTRSCIDVCSEGSRKLPMSVLPVADGLLIAGLGTADHALLVAAWLVLATGLDIGDSTPPTADDPVGGYLYAAVSDGGLDALVDAAMAELAVRELPGFADEILTRLEHLVAVGASAFTNRDSAVPLP